MLNDYHKIRLWIFILGLIFVLQIIGSAILFRNSNKILASNIGQITSLITEIGQIKEENQLLKEKIDAAVITEKEQRNYYLNNLLKLQAFIQKEQQKYSLEKGQIQTELEQKNNQLNQQKQLIADLTVIKATAKQFDDLNDQIYSILILGQNQGLTDTILLVIINPQSQKITLLSIPRDLFYDGRKINEYNKFYGIEKTSEVIKKITGITPDKYLEIDFKAFINIIDLIGGINIKIDKEIIDNQYPNPNNKGYLKVVFHPGVEEMNGERALQYARSRKSTSDFDRSLRQQQILVAVKEKLKTLNVLDNLQFFIGAYQNISQNVQSNLSVLEALELFEKYKNFNLSIGNILNNQNYLYNSKSLAGQYILLPKDNSFLKFQQKILAII